MIPVKHGEQKDIVVNPQSSEESYRYFLESQ